MGSFDLSWTIDTGFFIIHDPSDKTGGSPWRAAPLTIGKGRIEVILIPSPFNPITRGPRWLHLS